MDGNELEALPVDYELDEYRIQKTLGRGGFAFTYLALDQNLSREVAIKEYLPARFATRASNATVRALSEQHEETFQWGLERFLLEAQTLARFHHRSIVAVRRFFRANGTGYLVMDYEKGEDLEAILRREGPPSEKQLRVCISLVLDGLEQVHAGGVLHRDIKPANVYIRTDGTPVLLDFGAARQALGERTHAMTSIWTAGYAPVEQYDSSSEQGPWTDIYAVGATAYRAITGTKPPEAPGRCVQDRFVPAVQAARGRYSPELLRAIDASLAVDPRQRPQSIAEWRPLFERPPSVVPTPSDQGEDATQPAPGAEASTWKAPEVAPPTELPPRRRAPSWPWVAAAILVLVAAPLAYLAVRVIIAPLPPKPQTPPPGVEEPTPDPRFASLRAQAAALEKEGKLFEPADDSAVALYRRLRDLGDPAGWDGLLRISRRYRERGSDEVRRGDEFGAVESYMQARMAVQESDGTNSDRGVESEKVNAEIAASSGALAELSAVEASEEIPALSAMINDLKLFEKGPEQFPKARAAAFRSRFRAAAARYICYELEYVHPKAEEEREVVFAAVLYKEEDAYSTSDKARVSTEGDARSSWFQSCMGADTPGSWTPGRYRYDVYADGRKVASRSFEVTP